MSFFPTRGKTRFVKKVTSLILNLEKIRVDITRSEAHEFNVLLSFTKPCSSNRS